MLNRVGAIVTESHIVYTSGKHGTAYVDKDRVSLDPEFLNIFAQSIATDLLSERIEVVVAPALGAITLGSWTAYHLASLSHTNVKSMIAEKTLGDFFLRPKDDALISGKRVLVVEDILTTGGSALKVVEAVRAKGGEVVAVAVLCNRGEVTPEMIGGVPKLLALANMKLDAWDEADCPMCREGIPINTEVGKGREFLARKQA